MDHEKMPLATTLAEIAVSFRGVILDIFGVIHDGTQLFEPVTDALRRMRTEGLRVCLLSNAPRRQAVVASRLAAMGLGCEFYDTLITSGELAYAAFDSPIRPAGLPAGQRYMHVGPAELSDLLSGLAIEPTTDLADANFVLVTGDVVDRRPLLQQLLQWRLPMICANPDLDVMIGNQRVLCAGSVATAFEAMGGSVIRFGKPEVAAYVTALRMLDLQAADVIAIGDNLATDILGANRAGICSALVLTGVHQNDAWRNDGPNLKALAALCKRYHASPDYLLRRLSWS
jgi:HAD superfamily hydrolase (TIGR01459 family)